MRCEFAGCDNIITQQNPGARIGFTVNNLNRELRACSGCATKVLSAPRGTFEITARKELRINRRPTIIT